MIYSVVHSYIRRSYEYYAIHKCIKRIKFMAIKQKVSKQYEHYDYLFLIFYNFFDYY